MANLIDNIKQSLSPKKELVSENSAPNDAVAELRNWYHDRYESILVQRNFLFLLVVFASVLILSSVYVVGEIAANKNIKPFVVEIEDKTGITNLVNPLTRTEFTSNQALNSYFIMQYIRSRETYDAMTYQYNYQTITRLYSEREIYANFWSNMQSDKNNPISVYGKNNSTLLKLRSIQFPEDNKAQVRFTLVENAGQKRSYPKIVTLIFEYKELDLTIDERQVNPLGFQVTQYRIDDEIL
jgi:type IV secretion system protein VirB8